MHITFEPLNKTHFDLLLEWLQMPHVKTWWDTGVVWTRDLIEKKYATYVDCYKLEHGLFKPIYAFIISCDDVPIGYIQYYDVRDFPREYDFNSQELPESCATFDWYIGDPVYVGKGVGTVVLELFLNTIVFVVFKAAFVDVNSNNLVAIHVYEKVGFKKIKLAAHGTITWMIKEIN